MNIMNERAELIEAVAKALTSFHRGDWETLLPDGRQRQREAAAELLSLLDALGYKVVSKTRGEACKHHIPTKGEGTN